VGAGGVARGGELEIGRWNLTPDPEFQSSIEKVVAPANCATYIPESPFSSIETKAARAGLKETREKRQKVGREGRRSKEGEGGSLLHFNILPHS
jgi:hypothetical protein